MLFRFYNTGINEKAMVRNNSMLWGIVNHLIENNE